MRLIGSFSVYRLPLNPLSSAKAFFGACIAFPLFLFGEPLALFGTLRGALGHSLVHLRLHWGVLGLPWDHFGTLWDTLGSMLGFLGIILDHIGDLVSAGNLTANQWLSSSTPAHKDTDGGGPGSPGEMLS